MSTFTQNVFTTHTYLTFALSLINTDGRNAAVDPSWGQLYISNTEFGKLISPEPEINIVEQLILQSWSFSHDDNSLIFL